MTIKHFAGLPFVSLLALFVGCSDSVEYGWNPATLTRASSCTDLERQLKEDALTQMHAELDARIAELEAPAERDFAEGVAADGSGEQAAPPTGTDDGTPDHSETNVQVEGVDEADIVKTDGNYVYDLHGRSLAIVTAWPTSALELASTTPIEGFPLEMLVTEAAVVVYSRVDGQSIFEEHGLPPRDDPNGYDYPAPGYGYGSGYPSLTKVTVLAKSGASATVAAEYYFEGEYLSSRRIDSQVRTVVTTSTYNQVWQRSPDYDGWGGGYDDDDLVDAYEELRSDNIYRIATATLDDFLAHRFVKNGDEIEKLPCACTDTWLPTPGTTQHGVTLLEAFDLDDLGAGLHETQIVGAVQAVYSNAEALYLAASHWQSPMWGAIAPVDPVSVSATHLHKFDIATDPARPRYVASGSIPGEIHNQFSLDERDGVLRVATTDRTVSEDGSLITSNVFTLAAAGGALQVVGAVGGIAPGESIYSTRFVGDRGYVVTFRQVDPLFVFDLANPAAPTLLGELEIPGFSEYMHPLDEGRYLLTIGRDGNQWGATGSPALQIFDVRDGAHPALVHKYPLPEGWSEAEDNHKAITFYHDYVALPLTRYDGSWASTLELFAVDAEAGITLRGSVDHSEFFTNLGDGGYCSGYGVGVRRGVFIDEYVYSVSNGGIVVNALGDMSTPVASLTLPALSESYDCVY